MFNSARSFRIPHRLISQPPAHACFERLSHIRNDLDLQLVAVADRPCELALEHSLGLDDAVAHQLVQGNPKRVCDLHKRGEAYLGVTGFDMP